MNIFDKTERTIKCVDKYPALPPGDYELLEVGKIYTVANVDVDDWFTMIELKEFPGKRFNSVLFEESEE